MSGSKGAEPGLRRIVVVGTSGSGKTTLARKIAYRLGVAHIELDALHWAPNWTEVPNEVMRERVAEALTGDSWVTDGNYSIVRDIVWGRADTVVWLDYSLPRVLWQVTTRTIRRAISQEELWHGNRESLRKSFFTKDSIIWWALTTFHRRRRDYPVWLRSPEYSHLEVVHMRSPRQTREWVSRLPGKVDIATQSPVGLPKQVV